MKKVCVPSRCPHVTGMKKEGAIVVGLLEDDLIDCTVVVADRDGKIGPVDRMHKYVSQI